MNARRAASIWGGLALAALALFVAQLVLGSVRLAPADALAALLPRGASPGQGAGALAH